jgi:hypothetical protein
MAPASGKRPERTVAGLKDMKNKPFKAQNFVVVVENGEPSLLGPYDTYQERDAAAKGVTDVEEGVFWLDIRADGPHIGAFTTDDEPDDTNAVVLYQDESEHATMRIVAKGAEPPKNATKIGEYINAQAAEDDAINALGNQFPKKDSDELMGMVMDESWKGKPA